MIACLAGDQNPYGSKLDLKTCPVIHQLGVGVQVLRYMKIKDTHRTGILYIASIAKLLPTGRTWPIANREFAVTAKALAEKGNQFASQFWVTTNVAGSHAPEYNDLLSLMHMAGLISYDESSGYNRFYVRITPRGARALIRREAILPEESSEALEFAQEHWKNALETDDLLSPGVES